MEQKKVARKLKIFTVITAVVAGLFFFLYLPALIGELAESIPEAAWLRWKGTAAVWLIALMLYAALLFFWRICTRIGKGNSFCRENMRDMKRIGICAFLVLAVIVLGVIFLAMIHYLNAAWMAVAFFSGFGACGIGVICFCLSRLIANAAEIKQENDLTV